MLDLTFGEQVKIILSRRGMTIKELAETIEARTGKKMSRQNLTQRLGRDNFQEQDMRMIAEILGCPFQLSILGESIPTEKSQHNKAADTEVPGTGQAVPVVRERDITIGELVDINEKLDAMLAEASASEIVPESDEVFASGAVTEEGQQEELVENVTEENQQEEPVESVTEEAAGEGYDTVNEVPVPEKTEEMTAETYDIPKEDTDVDAEADADNLAEAETGYQAEMPEYTESYMAEYAVEKEAEEPVQTVSEEAEEMIQTMPEEAEQKALEEPDTVPEEPENTANKAVQPEEKKEVPEKKVRGWRAYLKKYMKKQQEPAAPVSESSREAEENHTVEAAVDAENAENAAWKEPAESSDIIEEIREDAVTAEYGQDERLAEYADGYPAEYAEAYQGTNQNEYSEGYAEEYVQENVAEEGYAETYGENYIDGNQEEEAYGQPDVQEAYEQEPEIPEEEEDLVNGDVNPYTGREYQSNSVRMHPSRIGYVQVYDRSIHAWTDMTEWAFLGYQERKKMLLGKDYDPPIYLD